MAKDLSELGLDINDLEIVPEPRFETPRQFLEYYAPMQDWNTSHEFTWEDVHKTPELQTILTNVVMRNTRPLILRKKA